MIPEIATAAEVGQLCRFQQAELFRECILAEITGVVVGHADHVEIFLDQRNGARIGAKRERLDFGRARRCDDAFEIGDAQPIGLERLCEAGQRIGAVDDQRSGFLGDHQVTDEGDGDRGLTAGKLEYRNRRTGETAELPSNAVLEQLQQRLAR